MQIKRIKLHLLQKKKKVSTAYSSCHNINIEKLTYASHVWDVFKCFCIVIQNESAWQVRGENVQFGPANLNLVLASIRFYSSEQESDYRQQKC